MSYTRPSPSAASASWSGDEGYVRPVPSQSSVDWLESEIRRPRITSTSYANAVSLVTAVSVGSANSASTADATHSDRTPDVIYGTSFVVGTGNAAGVTKGDVSSSAVVQGYGDGLAVIVGSSQGSSSAFAPSLISLISTGTSAGTSLADGRGVFNKDFAGKCSASSAAQGRSLVTATATGLCFGRSSVLSNYRPRARVQRIPVPTFSTDGRATGTSFGRATVGRRPKWRKVPVIIPQFGNPAIGTVQGSSRVSGVPSHG